MAQTLFQPIQCSLDSQGRQVCIGTQSGKNVCGIRTFSFPGLGTTYTNLPCDDVVIQSNAPDGHLIYKRILGGVSENLPRRFFFDAQDNVVLIGTTWSSDFFTSPNAVQQTYAGPPPAAVSPYPYGAAPPKGGGDLFLSVLDPAGNLLYSTFLGSSGSDDILEIQADSHRRVHVLVSAGAGNFPATSADVEQPGSGLVLLRIDLNRPAAVRSAYLPIGPGPYTASFGNHGSVAVSTSGGLYTFGPGGRLRTFVSLDSFAFDNPPAASTDPAGDFWLLGTTKNRPIITKLAGGTVEVFRWTLPAADTFLLPPFFGSDGLTYFGGIQYFLTRDRTLLPITPNALLTAPCDTSAGIVAALGSQGEVRLLSYLRLGAKSFAANPDGSVSVILNDTPGTSILVDLNPPPTTACALDGLDRIFYQPFGVGQTVRLRGGGFGPASPVAVTPGVNQTFPESLDGLQIQVNGIPAPILSAARGEVVFAIPFGTPEGDAVPVSVQDQGQWSAPLMIKVQTVSPLIVSILNQDGKPNSYLAPASPGSTVTLLLTGMGSYTPPLADGQIAPSDAQRSIAQPITLTFQTSASKLDPGEILYAGPAPGAIGQAEIKVQLPSSQPSFFSEDFPTLTVGSVTAFVPGIIVQ
jgi:uncharacterized protein (TIGR03437 family)